MAKVFVHIEATVAPDGKEAKAAMKPDIKSKILAEMVKAIEGGMPSSVFSTKKSDAPKKDPKAGKGASNAVKVGATAKFKLAPKGKGVNVDLTTRLTYEGIKWPKTSDGSLLAGSKTGGGVDVGKVDAKQILGAVGDICGAALTPSIKTTMSGAKFKKMMGNVGIKVP